MESVNKHSNEKYELAVVLTMVMELVGQDLGLHSKNHGLALVHTMG